MGVKALPCPKPASDKEIIQYLRFLLRKAHSHEIVWLNIDGAVKGKFGIEEYLTFDFSD